MDASLEKQMVQTPGGFMISAALHALLCQQGCEQHADEIGKRWQTLVQLADAPNGKLWQMERVDPPMRQPLELRSAAEKATYKVVPVIVDCLPGAQLNCPLRLGRLHVDEFHQMLTRWRAQLCTVNGDYLEPCADGWSSQVFDLNESLHVHAVPTTETFRAYPQDKSLWQWVSGALWGSV